MSALGQRAVSDDPDETATADASSKAPAIVRAAVANWDRLPERYQTAIVAMLEASPLADPGAPIPKR